MKNNSKGILWQSSGSPCPLAYEILNFLVCFRDYEGKEGSKENK